MYRASNVKKSSSFADFLNRVGVAFGRTVEFEKTRCVALANEGLLSCGFAELEYVIAKLDLIASCSVERASGVLIVVVVGVQVKVRTVLAAINSHQYCQSTRPDRPGLEFLSFFLTTYSMT